MRSYALRLQYGSQPVQVVILIGGCVAQWIRDPGQILTWIIAILPRSACGVRNIGQRAQIIVLITGRMILWIDLVG